MNKPRAKDNILSMHERDVLVKSARPGQEELIVRGLLYTGMRVSEFLHMHSDWINWGEGIIHVPRQIPCRCSASCREPRYKYYKRDQKTKKRIRLKTPVLDKPADTWQVKTSAGERPIPILPELNKVLREYF